MPISLLKQLAFSSLWQRGLSIPSRTGAPSEAIGQSMYEWDDLYKRFGTAVAAAPTTELCFTRHGQSSYNARGLVSGKVNSSLTARGRQQAKMLATTLTTPIDLVYCSTLRRAMQTAKILRTTSRGSLKHIKYDSRLNERSLGVLEQQPRHYIPEFARGDLDYKPQDGESYRELARRCFSFLLDLMIDLAALNHAPNHVITVLVITHVGPMRVFEAAAGKVETPRDMMALKLDNLAMRCVASSELILPSFFRD